MLLPLIPEDADDDIVRDILALDEDYPYRHTPGESQLRRLKKLYRKATGSERPLVVDPMAGGGSIPFEALRLGCRVVACEYNPVAWLVLKATLEYPVEYGDELIEEMRRLFAEIRKELEQRVGEFYGNNDRAYVWIKWVEYPRCGLKIPCTPNWWY